jgi:chromosome segregation ATPase
MYEQKQWMRPEDVRTPVTVKEAEAALDMIDIALDRLEGIVAKKEAEGGTEWTGMRRLIGTWENKRAEVAYALERLEAGDLPLSIELAQARAKIEALTAEVAELRSSLVSARALTDNANNARRARVASTESMKKQIADLIAKNERLSAALQDTHVPRPPLPATDERVKMLKKSHHDVLAFGAEALDELIASGVNLTPLALLFFDECNDSLPRGYRITWRAMDYPHKRTAAFARHAVAS